MRAEGSDNWTVKLQAAKEKAPPRAFRKIAFPAVRLYHRKYAGNSEAHMNGRFRSVLLALALVAALPQAAAGETPQQKQVERNSEQVMPFSMDATMHRFKPTADGGVQ